MSYSPSCLFADVLVSDGSVSGSFITFGPAAAQTALGDSCLSPVEARSGGDPTPPLTSLLLLWWCVPSVAAFSHKKNKKSRCPWVFLTLFMTATWQWRQLALLSLKIAVSGAVMVPELQICVPWLGCIPQLEVLQSCWAPRAHHLCLEDSAGISYVCVCRWDLLLEPELVRGAGRADGQQRFSPVWAWAAVCCGTVLWASFCTGCFFMQGALTGNFNILC